MKFPGNIDPSSVPNLGGAAPSGEIDLSGQSPISDQQFRLGLLTILNNLYGAVASLSMTATKTWMPHNSMQTESQTYALGAIAQALANAGLISLETEGEDTTHPTDSETQEETGHTHPESDPED
jgi:hypothetical protein